MYAISVLIDVGIDEPYPAKYEVRELSIKVLYVFFVVPPLGR
jgi:hypothetical protein